MKSTSIILAVVSLLAIVGIGYLIWSTPNITQVSEIVESQFKAREERILSRVVPQLNLLKNRIGATAAAPRSLEELIDTLIALSIGRPEEPSPRKQEYLEVGTLVADKVLSTDVEFVRAKGATMNASSVVADQSESEEYALVKDDTIVGSFFTKDDKTILTMKQGSNTISLVVDDQDLVNVDLHHRNDVNLRLGTNAKSATLMLGGPQETLGVIVAGHSKGGQMSIIQEKPKPWINIPEVPNN